MSIRFMDGKEKMDMIRHDHISVYRYMFVKCIHLPDESIRNFSMP